MSPADPRRKGGAHAPPDPWHDADARLAYHAGMVALYTLPLAAWLAAVWLWCVP